MRIETKYFGSLEIDKEEIVTFEQGVPGFLDNNQFIFQPLEESELFIMQSIDNSNLAFVVTSPFTLFNDYEIQLSDSVLEQLEIKKESEVVVFVILTVKNPFLQSTANLLGPIILNTSKKLGKQVILEHSPYKTRHLLSEDVLVKGGQE